jgi:hypothetical protein
VPQLRIRHIATANRWKSKNRKVLRGYLSPPPSFYSRRFQGFNQCQTLQFQQLASGWVVLKRASTAAPKGSEILVEYLVLGLLMIAGWQGAAA